MSAIAASAPGEIGAVMPVAPFGRPIDVHAWDRFRAASGVPVVIDAAAAFDTVVASATPSIVSLHATKVLGIGEGGFVLCNNIELIRAIRARMNFGFHGRREAVVEAFNGKLSEYHAAVGLAAMDTWVGDRGEWLAIAARYRQRLAASRLARLQDGFGETWVSSVCVLDLGRADADRLEPRLAAAGIETRRWWGAGAHAHPSTAKWPRAPLPVTEALSASTLAVPMFRGMSAADVDRVVDFLETATVRLTDAAPEAECEWHPDVTDSWLAELPSVVAGRHPDPVALRRLKLFAALTPAQAATAATLAVRRDAAAGERLIEQWAISRDFFVLLSGEAEVLVDGRPVRALGPGDVFGELAALEWARGFGYPRLAAVIATEPSELLVFPDGALNVLMRRLPSVRDQITTVVQERLPQA
jgi:hypothetical protein